MRRVPDHRLRRLVVAVVAVVALVVIAVALVALLAGLGFGAGIGLRAGAERRNGDDSDPCRPARRHALVDCRSAPRQRRP